MDCRSDESIYSMGISTVSVLDLIRELSTELVNLRQEFRLYREKTTQEITELKSRIDPLEKYEHILKKRDEYAFAAKEQHKENLLARDVRGRLFEDYVNYQADIGDAWGYFWQAKAILAKEKRRVSVWSDKARELLKRSAEQGHVHGQYDYGKYLCSQRLNKKDMVIGMEYMESAIKDGHQSSGTALDEARKFYNGFFATSIFPVLNVNVFPSVAENLEFIEIPNTVLTLGVKCLSECSTLKQITFEEGSRLTQIGPEVFCNATIESIKVPRSVEWLCARCFADCRNLTRVDFEEDSQLKAIGECAFADSGLVSFEMPDLVETITGNVFRGCNITNMQISESNKHFVVCDSMILTADMTAVVCSFQSSTLAVKIPPTVERLSSCCFEGATIKKLTFAEKGALKAIEGKAFAEASIGAITIPKSVEIIGEFCFWNCGKLKVKFAEGSQLKRIENYAFCDCDLRSINLPQDVDYVGEKAFSIPKAGE